MVIFYFSRLLRRHPPLVISNRLYDFNWNCQPDFAVHKETLFRKSRSADSIEVYENAKQVRKQLISHPEMGYIFHLRIRKNKLYVLAFNSTDSKQCIFVFTLQGSMTNFIKTYGVYDKLSVSSRYVVIVGGCFCAIFSPEFQQVEKWMVSSWSSEHDVWVRRNLIYMCDPGGNCINVFSLKGQKLTTFSHTSIVGPVALCLTSQFIYVAHCEGITILDHDGQMEQIYSLKPCRTSPHCMVVDDSVLYLTYWGYPPEIIGFTWLLSQNDVTS